MSYKCNECDKEFNYKSQYDIHLNRKFSCVKNIKQVDVSQNKDLLNLQKTMINSDNSVKTSTKTTPKSTKIENFNEKHPPKSTKIHQNRKFSKKTSTKNTPKSTEILENFENSENSEIFLDYLDVTNISQNTNNIKKYNCTYCSKRFTRSDSLKRHIMTRCKVKNDKNIEQEINKDEINKDEINKDEILEQMRILQKEYIDLKEELDKIKNPSIILNNTNTDNSINTNINNMTINLVAFGKENLDEILSDQICNKILERGLNAIPILIEYVHFNKKKPEYHNCYVSNMRDNHANVYDGEKWCLVDINTTIQDITEKEGEFLENKYESLASESKLTDKSDTQFKRYLKIKDDTELLKRYKNDIKLMFYNNRDIVMESKKLIK